MKTLPHLSGVIGLLSLLGGGSVVAQTAADSAGIRSAALNYIEGWYTADARRMEQALHPALAKRIVETDPKSHTSVLGHMGAKELIQSTGTGGGRAAKRRQTGVSILDIYRGAASAKIIAGDWVDYLHLARWNGRWVIVNVLWEWKPAESRASK